MAYGMLFLVVWVLVFIYLHVRLLLRDYMRILSFAFLIVLIYGVFIVVGFAAAYYVLFLHDLTELVNQYKSYYPNVSDLGAVIPLNAEFQHFAGLHWGDVHKSPVITGFIKMSFISAFTFVGASYDDVKLLYPLDILSLVEMFMGSVFPAIFIALIIARQLDDLKSKNAADESRAKFDVDLLAIYLNRGWHIVKYSMTEHWVWIELRGPYASRRILSLHTSDKLQRILKEFH
jgi:hypothetical protein